MSDCAFCHGTGLQPYSKHEGSKLLYTENECQLCGGKGWVDTGAGSYKVAVYVNSHKVLSIGVLARNAVEALRKGSEMVMVSMAGGLKPGDVMGMEVTEQ